MMRWLGSAILVVAGLAALKVETAHGQNDRVGRIMTVLGPIAWPLSIVSRAAILPALWIRRMSDAL